MAYLDPRPSHPYIPCAMAQSTDELKSLFAKTFSSDGRIHVIRAPGRVNIIGEHTDYNDGFVFPMAIEPEVRLVCRQRADSIVRVASSAYPGQMVEFSLDKQIERAEPTWGNYVRGVAAEMLKAGLPLAGMDALMTNTLPVGSGLSSSAAIEISMAVGLLVVGGLELEISRMALLCQRAEHEYALMPSGIMDQTIVSGGREGHAMLLDCRSLDKQFIPINPNDLRVVICNTMVKHELPTGDYATRLKECQEGVAVFAKDHPGVKALRDVSLRQLEEAKDKLPQLIYRRCRHVIGENHRCTETAKLLGRQEYEDVGKLMVQSHNSLRDDYQVSCAELDFLVAEAMNVKGVYGARMTGAGFGGCIVALTQPRAADALQAHLKKTYKAKFHIDPVAFVTTATAGASVLE